MPIRIAPSILAADFLHLDKEIEMLKSKVAQLENSLRLKKLKDSI